MPLTSRLSSSRHPHAEVDMSEQHDEQDPHVHRAVEADEPQSVEHVPNTALRTGELDQAGGQAGLMEVDNDLELGDESLAGTADSRRSDVRSAD
jgi:hypothetical protein